MFMVYLGNSLTCKTKVNCILQSIFSLFHSNCSSRFHQLLSWRFFSLPCSWVSQSYWRKVIESGVQTPYILLQSSISLPLLPMSWVCNLTEPASIIPQPTTFQGIMEQQREISGFLESSCRTEQLPYTVLPIERGCFVWNIRASTWLETMWFGFCHRRADFALSNI